LSSWSWSTRAHDLVGRKVGEVADDTGSK
jgi:hypothetical protein